ncbi:MAG: endonuclease V [Bacteroidota bacterium]
MLIAIDVHYRNDIAKTVSIEFTDWQSRTPLRVHTQELKGLAEYIPGQFYKRELPCLQSILQESDLREAEAIIIDGYVVLDDEGKNGLGGYLYEALAGRIPVIGVAKKKFHQNEQQVIEVFRGESQKPLYVSSRGIDLEMAADCIRNMYGEYRMPELLKLVDRLTKEEI